MFWLALAGLLLTCLAAIGARSLAEFSPHELKEICRRRKTPERLTQILNQAGVAFLYADNFDPFCPGGAHNRPNRRIHPGTITATGQDCYLFHNISM